jgi:hypothetical protein
MLSVMKKALATVIAAILVVSTPVHAAPGSNTQGNVTSNQEAVKLETENKEVSETVDTKEDGTAVYDAIDTKDKTVRVPTSVVVDGVEYTVTEIGPKAFKNAKNATKVVISSTITQIDKKAFSKAKKLKKIKFNNTKSIKVEKGAFKGLDTSKMTIKVTKKMSKKQFKKFKKALRKAGFKGTIKQ